MLHIPLNRLLFALASLAILLGSGAACATKESPHSGPVMNYHRVDDRLVTGGHLIDDGAMLLREQGVKVVIDLRDDSPAGEKERFAAQGIEWINVPVAWRKPLMGNFERFSAVMQEHQDEHIMVQCAANYRASAMTYLYRVSVEGIDESEAREDLNAVWDPEENDTWRRFIDDVNAAAREQAASE